MSAARGAIQGAAGGAVCGALLGIDEASFLLWTSGAPDLLSPFYAAALYGLIGLGIGLVAGLVVGRLMQRGPMARRIGDFDDAALFAIGGVAAVTPMALFILRYLVNKEIYAERGVPLPAMLGILGAVGFVALLIFFVGGRLVRGPFSFVLRGPGAVGVLASLLAITGAVSRVDTGGDPRTSWAHGKPAPAALAEKPNVLYVMVDTLRADYLGAYGKADAKTPVIDALAADSIVFEQGFAQASWTRASGASQLSSRLPSGHNAALKAARLPDEVTIWPEVLHEAGVVTGALINNINLTATFNFDQGYDTFIYEAPDYVFGASESVFGLTLYKVVHKLHEKVVKSKAVQHFYQPAEVVLADARGFIEANEGARWSLFVHLMEPHDPYFEHPNIDGSGSQEYNGVGFARAEVENPDPAKTEYLKRVYAEEIQFMDRRLEPFLSWLKASGHYDNTLIVFTSDHGEEFYEHGGWWHGTTLYDEQLHVPMIVKLPKQELAGTRAPWQVRSIDLAPTITAALGLESPKEWEGKDLIADLRAQLQAEADAAAAALAAAEAALAAAGEAELLPEGEQAPAPSEVVLEQVDPCAAYVHPRDRIVLAEEDFEGNVLSAIRSGGFKLITANEGNPRGLGETELYDVVDDPAELKDLSEDGSQRCGSYMESRISEARGVMEKAIAISKAGATATTQTELTEAERQALEALGYLDVAN